MAELLKREGNQVEFRVTVGKSDVQSAFNQVWSAVSRDVRVPGFRPGKAPRSVLEKRVGRGYVEGEVRDRLLDTFYPQAVRELQLNIVDAEITPETPQDGNDFSFTVRGETYPAVTLPNWRTFSLTASAPDITDDVLERTLRDLQERNATFESVERPVEATDMVTIEERGEDADGGTYPIYLDVAEEHVRDALVGKNIGDEVTITVPAHSHGDHEHAESSVSVKIIDVKHKQLQDLNEEFAKSLNFESLERLRKDLRSELERRAKNEGESARREQFVSQLADDMTVDVPSAMIRRRQEAMLDEIKDDLSRQGVKWDEYEKFMDEQGKLDEFVADLRKNAETRVKRDLALEQLAEDLGVRVSQSEFDASLRALATANRLSIEELRKQLGENGLNGYLATLVRDKALARAVELLTATQADAANAAQATEAAQASAETSSEGSEASAEQENAAAIDASDEPVTEVGSGAVAQTEASDEQSELTQQPIAEFASDQEGASGEESSGEAKSE
ncbi:trigger factor [Deinococcus yavapaiensis]|uniref:Trigger factor n=1 Tax=Deinococcus yavapaiensis KR-236 TaxID=694435 RepID=A0A318RZI6_9DEIO|nr:trigger factor [Deinococcus yavapaiensis]PYE49014.1 trigger factor [Deinococcus yavapaiensis KR-236]